jgi:transposase
MTTKILALTDALGNLVRFVLLPGQRYDTVGVAPLIEGVEFGALIADKAFDSNDIVANLNERGAKIVISQHPRRTAPLQIDTEMYKWRHLIENFLQAQGVQAYRPARRQNRSELPGHDPSRRYRHQFTMNLNRP